MKKIILKRTMLPDPKKRYLAMEETIRSPKIRTTTKKTSFTYIKSIHTVTNAESIKDLVDKSTEKDVNIFRKSNDKETLMKCRVKGSFSVIAHGKIFNIIFVHSITIRMQKK